MTSTLKLTIDGMHCGACVRRVTTALESVDGVTVASVQVGSAEVLVDAAKTSSEEVVSSLDRIGFRAGTAA